MFEPIRYFLWDDHVQVAVPPSMLWLGAALAAIGLALVIRAVSDLGKLPESRESAANRWKSAEVAAVFAVASVLRFACAHWQPLTEFETGTLYNISKKGLLPDLRGLMSQVQLGYFPLTGLSAGLLRPIFGELMGGRIISVLLGSVGAVALGLACGREMSRRSRLAVYLLVVSSPIAVYISGLMTGYAGVLCGQALLVLGATDLELGRDRSGWGLIFAGAAIALSSHALGVYTAIPITGILLLRLSSGGTARRASLLGLLGLAGIAMICAPWLIVAVIRGSRDASAHAHFALAAVAPGGVPAAAVRHIHQLADLGLASHLPIPGLAWLLAAFTVVGLWLDASRAPVRAVLAGGLVLTFIACFITTSGLFVGPNAGHFYFHVRHFGTLVVLTVLAMRGWLGLRGLYGTPGWLLALCSAAGLIFLARLPQRPAYRQAMAGIARDFRPGDGLLLLPSYTAWGVIDWYGRQEAYSAHNTGLARVLGLGRRSARFVLGVGVPPEQKLENLFIEGLWVIVLDDRVLGVYPHYDMSFASKDVAAVERIYEPEGPWTGYPFLRVRHYRRRFAPQPWPNDELVIRAGENDLYYLDRVMPDPTHPATARKIGRDTLLRLLAPPGACSLAIGVTTGSISEQDDLIIEAAGGASEQSEPGRIHVWVPPGKPLITVTLRPRSIYPVRVRQIRVRAIPCHM